MLKRLIAKIVMQGDQIVNSYGFGEYLPLGKIKPTLKRLEDWEIDEIVILQADHSEDPISDFCILKSNMGDLGLMTPMAYGGGITTVNQAKKIISLGADRVIVSACNGDFHYLIEEIGELLGDQSIILHLPISSVFKQGVKSIKIEDLPKVLRCLNQSWGGELLITDIESDGALDYNQRFYEDVQQNLLGFNFSYFGGICIDSDLNGFLGSVNLSGICVGNNLHRIENPVFNFRRKMLGEFRNDTLDLANFS